MSEIQEDVFVSVRVRLPLVPNFLRLADGGDGAVDIADLDNETLRSAARMWAQALVQRATERRKNRLSASEDTR